MSKSIISNEHHCFICGFPYVHKHHIYPGIGRRELSEHFGLWVYLCPRHHNQAGSYVAVHSGMPDGKEIDRKLRVLGQQKFEETHTRDEFRQLFGKSYLTDE